MSVNTLDAPGYGFNDMAALLNSIVGQATGREPFAIANTSDFVSVGQIALKAGFDPLLNAISQTLTSTIYSDRRYDGKFIGLRATSTAWGNHVRKLSIADSDWESDKSYYSAPGTFLKNGDSVDMYRIKAPTVLQTNYYGHNPFDDYYTIYRNQLNVAFTSPDELARFYAMVGGNMADRIAQAKEVTARTALANFIGGKVTAGGSNVIYLISEYNAQTGQNLTAATVNNPDNYATFIRWAYGYIKTLRDRFSERTINYQINVTGKEISRHTPAEYQKLYISSPQLNRMEAEVRSVTFNADMLGIGEVEGVGFWQSLSNPESVAVKPTYINTSGEIVVGNDIQVDRIFGVLIDEEAVMLQMINEWTAPTPFNAGGGYSNMWYHFDDRYLNDFTEKGVVLLLDEEPTP